MPKPRIIYPKFLRYKITEFKLYEKDVECYFDFAPSIYTLNKKQISFGLEILGRRFFKTEIVKED